MDFSFKCIWNEKYHSDAITSISNCKNNKSLFASSSRDKTILIWKVEDEESDKMVIALKRLKGHSHFVSCVKLSNNGDFCISSSWDNSLRLWDLMSAKTLRTLNGHKKSVLSVSFSEDERQIISCSRDCTIRIWNTVGECKKTLIDKGSSSWICNVILITNRNDEIISSNWDGEINLWNLRESKIQKKLIGHKNYVKELAISPDGSLCASGGGDKSIILWDLNEGKHLYSLEINDRIVSITFSPNHYWLTIGSYTKIMIWDLETKKMIFEYSLNDTVHDKIKAGKIYSLFWDNAGSKVIIGTIDGLIKILKY
ncbi:guanine nucleotide-binding protein beta SU like protein [Guillardia theta]|uniref:Guanine nucleotide-binding protein beta SU like protein n=1 Tax=Guillardia theta TaxID=55529 RepID=Q9AVW0_GUITH|nr:guanine nucleotide-binding protein beta SU like protein [Guillardia theta]CAC27111.1 guanine nucleotide-binding protein beta SU like protein [Guillardia theta]|mmetsp:Transcript_20159/g.67404  ORF Transcript_20159/g.67404 Transcript_20159/m.67404 type:complete len:312 (-) Transcript_20159:1351-2286(-)